MEIFYNIYFCQLCTWPRSTQWHLRVSWKSLGPHPTHPAFLTPLLLCTPFLCQITHTLYPWMSPFWLSTGGGSQVTSSCVAVALWMATFCGAAVGTGGHEGWGVSVHGSKLWKGRGAKAGWGPWILYLGLMRVRSPASPTKTSCGGLKGPSPTALYTLIRIS